MHFTDKETLYNDYINIGMSTRDIAKKYQVGQTTVRRLMKEYEIPSRKAGQQTQYYIDKMQATWNKYKEDYKIFYDKVCEWCGKEFRVNGEKKNNKFCSKECLHSFQLKDRKEQFCITCNKSLGFRSYKVSYCPECLSLHKKEIFTNRTETECGYCHKKLFVTPSRFNANKYCYCDVKCMALHYAQIYTGENSHSWEGGKKHYQGDWLKARNEARKRDNYKCAICGITEEQYGHQLSVHHIKLYREFEDKFEANKLDNLISLCEPCHRFVHSNCNTEKIYLEK